MPNRYRSGGAGNVDDGANIPPALALAMWNPFLAGALERNAQALEVLGEIGREWQDFVARRLKEDVELTQRLTSSSTPDHIMSAYADFWRKAAEDYGGEIATMTKLMTGITNRMVEAAQSATDEAGTKLLRRQAA